MNNQELQKNKQELLELLSSAHMIAKRRGADTNWEAFELSVEKALAIENRRPITARSYKAIKELYEEAK